MHARRTDTPANQGPELHKVIQGHCELVLSSRVSRVLVLLFSLSSYFLKEAKLRDVIRSLCVIWLVAHHTFCLHYSESRYSNLTSCLQFQCVLWVVCRVRKVKFRGASKVAVEDLKETIYVFVFSLRGVFFLWRDG